MKFKALGHSGVKKPGRLLESFTAPKCIQKVLMVSDEVTAVCPVSGQPDQYTVSIEYVPRILCIESKSLKLKLQSYRQKGVFCEALAADIAQHVFRSIAPKAVTVTVTQKSRGGVAIMATARVVG